MTRTGTLLLSQNDFSTMSFEDAIRSVPDGTIIDFEVSPGAMETKVPAGYNQWRKRILIKLKAQPERGKANEELIEALSSLFQVPSARIQITSGATNSRKSVKVKGFDRADAVKTLGSLI